MNDSGVTPADTDTGDKTFSSTPITIGGSALSGTFAKPVLASTSAGNMISTALQITDASGAAAVTGGAESTAYYLSTTPSLSGIIQPALATNNYSLTVSSGSPYTESQSITIPTGTAPGTYYLVAQIDSTQAINSADTNVFATSGAIKIGAGLQVNLGDTNIVPTKTVTKTSTGLHLSQLFGTEELTVPITLTNNGTSAIKDGKAELNLFASTDGSPSGPILNGPRPITLSNINLAVGKTSPATQFVEKVTISPTMALTAGQQYFIVAQITPELAAPATNKQSMQATANTFEFLGTPAVGVDSKGHSYNLTSFFTTNYIPLIENTLKNGTYYLSQKAGRKPAPSPTDLVGWVTLFEGPGNTPYTDSVGDPTIGYGLDLTDLDAVPGLETALYNDVVSYYATHYKLGSKPLRLSGLTPDQVVTMLSDQATNGFAMVPGIGKVTRRAALDNGSALSLLQMAIPIYNANAQQFVPNLNSLSPTAVVALEDFTFNSGSVYSNIAAALNQSTPDLALAGFALCNYPRTIRGGAGQLIRTEAEYQNLLGADPSSAAAMLLIGNG